MTERVRGLYAITSTAVLARTDYREKTEQALKGGVRVLQYRSKDEDDENAKTQAESLAGLCAAYRIPFIVNDDPALAFSVGATGVHLGREDVPIATARALLGRHSLVGVSCYNELDRAVEAQAAGADYVAFGSFYPSGTKPLAVRASIELLHAARARLHIPIVAIGGITPENGAALVAAGAHALAVVEGLFNQPDIAAAARAYAALFNET